MMPQLLMAQLVIKETIYNNQKSYRDGSFEATNGYLIISNTRYLSAGYDSLEVYKFNGESYEYHQTLSPSDAQEGDDMFLGYRMSADGGNLVVSASHKGDKDGGAYFYHLQDNGDWAEETILENPGVGNYYGGQNLAIHGDQVLVTRNNGWPDYMHVVSRDDQGNWSITDTIENSNYHSFYARKCYFDGQQFISALFTSGEVKSFSLNGTGEWQIDQEFPSLYGDRTYFGTVLDVSGDYLAMVDPDFSVPVDTGIVNEAGAVLIYKRNGLQWTLMDTIIPEVPMPKGEFGKYLTFDDGVLAVTAEIHKLPSDELIGGVYFYEQQGEDWTLRENVISNDSRDIGDHYFGQKIVADQGSYFVSTRYGVLRIAPGVKDCAGVLDGDAFIDDCDVCSGGDTGIEPNSTCKDCNGDVNGTASIDDCDVCSGGQTNIEPNSTCKDCNGEVNGTASVDDCDVCSGGQTGIEPNSTCKDCNGDVNGTASIDDCDVCSGGQTGVEPNSTCKDCNGDVNGTASIDNCDVCSGGQTGVEPNSTCKDCNGDVNGTASIDDCDVCSGGQTGVDPNSTCKDCNGELFGNALVDECGICAGGTTGIEPDESCKVTGFEDASLESIKVYPNPTEATIKLSESVDWVLHNAMGEELASGYGSEVDLRDYPSGIYFIQLDQKQTQKVVKK